MSRVLATVIPPQNIQYLTNIAAGPRLIENVYFLFKKYPNVAAENRLTVLAINIPRPIFSRKTNKPKSNTNCTPPTKRYFTSFI